MLVSKGSRVGWQSHAVPIKVAIDFVYGCCYQKKKNVKHPGVFSPSKELQVLQLYAVFTEVHLLDDHAKTLGLAFEGQDIRNSHVKNDCFTDEWTHQNESLGRAIRTGLIAESCYRIW